MPRHSRRKGYGKKRMHKHRGGGLWDSMKKSAADFHASATKSVANMDLAGKVEAGRAAAIAHANKAKQMAMDAHAKGMAAGADIHAQMKPHLDMVTSHANDLMTHAQNGDAASFKTSAGNFSSSMAAAATAGSNHALNTMEVGNATLADHARAAGDKVKSGVADFHGKVSSWFGGITGNSDNAAAAAGGGRRRRRSRKVRKSRKHPKKGQKSRTRKGRKDFTTKKGNKKYNRRGHRQSKNAKGKRGRPYRTRKARKH